MFPFLIMRTLKAILDDSLTSLDQPFAEARRYGRVYIHTCSDGTYTAKITSTTREHVEIEASSNFDHGTLQAALACALTRARSACGDRQ